MSDTETTTTTDEQDQEEPNPCRRFIPIPETGPDGSEMWTCPGPCHTSKETREEFEALERCQR